MTRAKFLLENLFISYIRCFEHKELPGPLFFCRGQGAYSYIYEHGGAA